jgi:coproporphyrinogen III oxidase-like Fe-S oxidoreductase
MQASESGNAVDHTWNIEKEDLGFEFMMNALRLTNGFEKKLFNERTGMSWEAISVRLTEASKQGLIKEDIQYIKPTLAGQRYLNNLLALFLN